LSTYQITWLGTEAEKDVTADRYYRDEGWFVFVKENEDVLRVRANDVSQITIK
jgi:hypothetical protein